MELVSILVSIFAASLLLIMPVNAQEQEYSNNPSTVVNSPNVWPGFDVNSSSEVSQGNISFESDGGFYAGVQVSQYASARYFGVYDGAYAAADVNLLSLFSIGNNVVDINFAVTNHLFTDDSIIFSEFEMGVTHDITAIHTLLDSDFSSTYFEINMRHGLHDLFSINTHMGVNDLGEQKFVDYAVWGDYEVSEVVSLIIGYSNYELASDIAGKQVFAGTSISF
jgi:hypothetical protein